MTTPKAVSPSPFRAIRSLPFWLATAFIALVVLLILTDRHWLRLELDRTANRAEQRLGVYQTSLQATIDRHFYLPRILASDPRIVDALADPDGQPGRTTSELLARINAQAGSDEIFLMDTTGLTRWSSNFQSDTSFVGNNYGFRPYFRSAMDGQPGFYFAVGATSGIPGLFLSAPVVDQLDTISGVIVVKIDLGPLEASWADSGDAVWVTDREGIVFLSSSPEWHYVATRPVSTEHRLRLIETRQYGSQPVRELDAVADWTGERWSGFELGEAGTHILFGSPVGGYPWTMHLRLPLAEVHRQVRWGQALAILLALTATGGILYGRERRRRASAQRAVIRLTEEREHHQRAIIQNTDAGLFNLDADLHPCSSTKKRGNCSGSGRTTNRCDRTD